MRAYRKVDEPYELKIEGGRLVLLGVGAALTLVLVFLVGVLVGKGLWGARTEAGVASAPGATQSATSESPRPQYTFYEDLKKPDGEVPGVKPAAVSDAPEAVAETPVSAPAASPPAESPPPGGDSGVKAPTPPASARSPEGQPTAARAAAKPAAAAPPTKAPEPVVAKAAVEQRLPAPLFTVQVGSFRDRASADDQAKKIAAQGVAAQVVAYPVEGRTWYRVQVGRFETRADAEAHYQKKLRNMGVQGFVTTR